MTLGNGSGGDFEASWGRHIQVYEDLPLTLTLAARCVHSLNTGSEIMLK